MIGYDVGIKRGQNALKRDLIGHAEKLVKCILLLVLLINTVENDFFFLIMQSFTDQKVV